MVASMRCKRDETGRTIPESAANEAEGRTRDAALLMRILTASSVSSTCAVRLLHHRDNTHCQTPSCAAVPSS